MLYTGGMEHPTNAQLKKAAAARVKLHAGSKSTRALGPDYQYVGLAGERAFAVEFGIPMDLELRPRGDGGVDFRTVAGTVDVKTYRKAYNLLREKGKPHADILVLAQYNEGARAAELVGWEYDSVLVRQPAKDFGYGVVNHYLHRSKLRPMKELHELLEG